MLVDQLFFPERVICPKCGTEKEKNKNIVLKGNNPQGGRDVYGLGGKERTFARQMYLCKPCNSTFSMGTMEVTNATEAKNESSKLVRSFRTFNY